MIILDKALQARSEAGAPVRVGLIGAGFIGKTIAKQITKSTPGMELVAIGVCPGGPSRCRVRPVRVGARSVRRSRSMRDHGRSLGSL